MEFRTSNRIWRGESQISPHLRGCGRLALSPRLQDWEVRYPLILSQFNGLEDSDSDRRILYSTRGELQG